MDKGMIGAYIFCWKKSLNIINYHRLYRKVEYLSNVSVINHDFAM